MKSPVARRSASRRWVRKLAVAGALMCVVIQTGCVESSEGEPSEVGRKQVLLTDDDVDPSKLGPRRVKIVAERGDLPPVAQEGTADVTLGEVSVFGGTVGLTAGPATDLALDFPSFNNEPDPARSVITVMNAGQGDALEPKSRLFYFASTIRLDRRSEGSEFDNGDNVLQRGLATDRVQFKLEIDHGVPRCTVRGLGGSVSVRARAALARERWYTLRCERVEDRKIRLVVLRDGEVVDKRRARGRIGRVAFGNRRIPMTVGGKVDSSLNLIDRSTDQFNGQIVNPTFGFLD